MLDLKMREQSLTVERGRLRLWNKALNERNKLVSEARRTLVEIHARISDLEETIKQVKNHLERDKEGKE